MFIQMGLLVPFAGLRILYRKLSLVVATRLVAMLRMMCTTGLLTDTGLTFHILSCIIPIFLMPIAVLDSIHILSEFFGNTQILKIRKQRLEASIKNWPLQSHLPS